MRDLITVEFDDGGLAAQLQSAVARLQSPRDLLRTLGAVLEANVAVRFQTKTDPGGSRWDALRPSTQASYAKRFKGNVPGTLLDRSFNGPGMRTTLTHNLVGDDAVEVGMSKAYALFHELGTKRMSRRGMFFDNPDAGTLGREDERDLSDAVVAFLDDVFGN